MTLAEQGLIIIAIALVVLGSRSLGRARKPTLRDVSIVVVVVGLGLGGWIVRNGRPSSEDR